MSVLRFLLKLEVSCRQEFWLTPLAPWLVNAKCPAKCTRWVVPERWQGHTVGSVLEGRCHHKEARGSSRALQWLAVGTRNAPSSRARWHWHVKAAASMAGSAVTQGLAMVNRTEWDGKGGPHGTAHVCRKRRRWSRDGWISSRGMVGEVEGGGTLSLASRVWGRKTRLSYPAAVRRKKRVKIQGE